VEIASEQRAAFYRTRTGALAGEALMRKYNWRVGDKISLKSPLKLKDGSDVWTFDVVGMYRFKDPGMKIWENLLVTNWDYIDQARESDTSTITWYSITVSDASENDRVSRAIDTMTANSGHETKTQSDNAFGASLIGEIGDLGRVVTSIMGAVFFTLLLLSGHTMMHAVNERIPEIAVLKTLGFRGRGIMGLVLGESILLLALGGVLGLAAASLIVFIVRATVGLMMPTDLPIPILPVGVDVWLRGMTFAVLIGLIVGAPPALRGLRLRIVDALSGR
jgi:putative ABC transport system permease protein